MIESGTRRSAREAERQGRNRPMMLRITASRSLRSTRVSSLSRLSNYHCPGQLAILLGPQLPLIAELKEKSKDTKEIQ